MLSKQSLTRSAGAPFAQGSHGLVQFSALCRREKQGKISRVQNRNQRKTESCALSFSRLRRQLPLGGSLCLCVFFLCAAEKTKGIFRTSKAKICTFFFYGSAVGHYEPSSGRKVSRVSVTKGARGTERRQIFLFLRRSLFPQRLPSF